MAYGLKYTHNFHQIKDYGNSSEWKLEIYLEGYGGATSEIEHIIKDSIVLGREGDLLNVVQGSKLSFSIVNETEAQYKEFRVATWGDYKAVLIKDPNGTPLTHFVGYNTSEIYTEPYNQPPYDSKLIFTCGLNHLKHVKWAPDNAIQDANVDTNVINTVSASAALPTQFEYIFIEVKALTGDHANHVVTLQYSADNVVWGDSSYFITGVGFFHAFKETGPTHYRLKVTTAEGTASIIEWETLIIHYGQKSIIEVLRLALNKLPSPLPIREIVNVYEDGILSTTTDSMLNQIYVDSSVYKEATEGEMWEEPFNCHKTIEEILRVFCVNIFQAGGYWYIVRINEYSLTDLWYRDFNANVGTESTITIDATGNLSSNRKTVTGPNRLSNELIIVAPETEMSVEPPLNRVQVVYDQSNIDQAGFNIIKYGEFLNPLTSISPFISPAGWAVNGSDTSQYYFRGRYCEGNSCFYTFNFDPATQATANTLNSAVYIEQQWTQLGTSTTDSLVFKFDFKADSTVTDPYIDFVQENRLRDFFSNNWIITFPIEIQLGTYYLHGDPLNGYSWVASPGIATFEYYEGADNTWRSGVTINSNTYTGFVRGKIDVVLPTLPENSYVDFIYKMYQPFTNVNAYVVGTTGALTRDADVIQFGNLSLIYLPDEFPPTETLVLSSKISEDEKIKKITVLHGDGTNTGALNSFRTSNGLITNNWNRRSITENISVLQLLLEQLASMKGTFTKVLSGKLIGEIDVFNTIIHATDVTAHYYINNYEWNIALSSYSIGLIEMWGTAATIINLDEVPKGTQYNPTQPAVGTSTTEVPPDDELAVSTSTTTQASQTSINTFI